MQLHLLSNSAHGPSYCRNGRTYSDTSKCATSWLVYHVISGEAMELKLNFRYTLPSTITNGLSGTNVIGSFTMKILDNYWSSEWSRIQDAWELNEWALIPPGPPHGKYSKRRRSNVAVIIVRIVFISSFLFYCLLLNHSFPTNPNRITNCFKLFSLLQLTTTLLLRRYFDF